MGQFRVKAWLSSRVSGESGVSDEAVGVWYGPCPIRKERDEGTAVYDLVCAYIEGNGRRLADKVAMWLHLQNGNSGTSGDHVITVSYRNQGEQEWHCLL